MNNTPEYTHSEWPAIQLFQKLGYSYKDASKNDERSAITEVILNDRLTQAIKRINPWINDNNLNKAFNLVNNLSGTSLMEINESLWHFIKGGTQTLKQTFNGEEEFKPVHFIDYNNVDNNDFLVVNQIKYHGKYQHSVPDLVVYVNGLPLAVIECKSPLAQNVWDKAYSDLKYYQDNSEKLFHYNQICLGLWKDGARYGAINASKQFYSFYRLKKDEKVEILGNKPTAQDILIYSLFKKESFLDIIRHFVLFEIDKGRTIKKYQDTNS